MADNYLALLDSSQRQGMAWAESVQRTLDSAFRVKEQARQFDKQIAVQQSQFAEEMAYKDATLEETRRVHNMNAERYSFLDELAAKKFGAEMALEPLRLETAKLGLEAQKINKERMLQQNRDQVFNSITKPFDTQAAALLSGSRSEEFGNSYLALKSKYQSDVAKGMPFNEEGFRSEYDALAAQYTEVVPNKEYNPALATMLDSMGAGNEANRMRAENPVFSGSVTGLKAGALTGGRDAFAATIGKYGNFLGNDEDIASFSMAGDAYFGLGDAIAIKSRELDTLNRSFATAKTKEDKERIEQDINQLRNEISEARTQRSALYQRAIGVQTATTTPEENISEEEQRARRNLGLAQSQTTETKAVTPEVPQFSDQNYDLRNKRANINAFKEQFPEALGGAEPFNFRSIQNAPRDLRNSEEAIKTLRNHVLRNLNSIPTNDREAAEMDAGFADSGITREKTKTLESLIQSPEFAKIFNELKGKSVRVPALGEGKGFSSAYIGDRSIGQAVSSVFTNFTDVGIELDSMDDVVKLLREYEGPAESKRLFMEKLYASVVAAGAVDAFSLPQ